MNEITLQQWKTQREEKLRAFELYWKSMVDQDPKDFPANIPAADWDEQFEFFCDEI